MFVTPERIMVAIGSTDGNGNYDPLRVSWTDTGNNQTWTGTAANLAGNFTLSNGTHLVRGIATRSENVILGNDMVYSMRFTSDPATVFNFDLIGTGCGLIGPNAVCEARGKLYWLSPSGQFYAYGNGVVEPLVSSVRRNMFSNLAWCNMIKFMRGIIQHITKYGGVIQRADMVTKYIVILFTVMQMEHGV